MRKDEFTGMSEDFSGNIISLTDEDGNELELEHLDTIEYNGTIYMAFYPVVPEDDVQAAQDEDNDEYGLILLRVEKDADGEEILVTIEDEEELNAVYEEFMETLFDEDEEEQ